MKDLQQVAANLEEIALLDQQIFCNDLKMLKEITTDVQKISKIPALERKDTFLKDVLGIDQKENEITKILEFFFNPPKKVHGYSDLFLTTLAECLNKKSDRIWDLNQKNFEEIEREHKFVDQSRIDLVLYFENLVLGIEHKIYAKLDNPLDKYLKGLQKIAKEPQKEAKLIIFSLSKYSAKELKNCIPAKELKSCINITYAEFYATLRNNYKALCSNKEKSSENLQKASRWQSIFEDFLISMENLTGVHNMTKEQKERQRLIWEFFTKNNLKEIIDEYESLKERFITLQEELAKSYKDRITEFGFKVTESWFDDESVDDYKLIYNISFNTKNKTELTLCIDNYGGVLSVSLLYGGEEVINNDDKFLTIGNDPHYKDDIWGDETVGAYYWRKVRVNDDFQYREIKSNPYADDFEKEVMAACEEILGTLAKALKYTK